jgi:predicted ATP-binding protein involved in virulence
MFLKTKMPNFIQSIQAVGIHRRFDIQQSFHPGVNILYGKNGSGKTTLLHIIANALNRDYPRFLYLDFVRIEIHMDDGTTLEIKTKKPNEEDSYIEITVKENGERRGKKFRRAKQEDNIEISNIDYQPITTAAYFPAFRSMIEAWISVKEEDLLRYYLNKDISKKAPLNNIQEQATYFSRRLFGDFVPELNYPSPLEIEQRLIDETREAILAVAKVDRDLLSQSFVEILTAFSSLETNRPLDPEEILKQIKSLSEKILSHPLQDSMFASDMKSKISEIVNLYRSEDSESKKFIAMILSVYQESLKKISDIQEKSFEPIDQYLASVNEFLEEKELKVSIQDRASSQPSVKLMFDNDTSNSIYTLSSGERQIITLLYAATHMSQQNLVLIDEPEISLHVDWQRLLLKKMSEQLGNRQIIACTHSPVIPADYEDNFVELNVMPTDRSSWYPDPEPDEYIDRDTIKDENAYLDADKLEYSEDEFNE